MIGRDICIPARLFVLCGLALMGNCASSSTLSQASGAQKALVIPAVASKGKFSAYGTVSASYMGEKIRAGIDVVRTTDSRFRCILTDFLGNTALSLSAEGDSARLITKEGEFSAPRSSPVENLPFFRGYPFTFDELERILTCSVPQRAIPENDPDSIWEDRRFKSSLWNLGKLQVKVEGFKRSGALAKVNVSSLAGATEWILEFGSYREGIAREIRFETSEMNYFAVTYEKVSISSSTYDK